MRTVSRTSGLALGLLVGFVAGAWPTWAVAQQTAVAVQLPTFSFFTVNTSVLVPDSGSGMAAAMRRRRAAEIMHGPIDRLSQSAAQAGGATVHATIHDRPQEPPLQLSGARGPQRPAFARQLDAAQRSTAGRPAQSVEEILAERADAEDVAGQEALDLFAEGRAAEQRDKPAVARVYYRRALHRADGELRQLLLQTLEAATATRGSP